MLILHVHVISNCWLGPKCHQPVAECTCSLTAVTSGYIFGIYSYRTCWLSVVMFMVREFIFCFRNTFLEKDFFFQYFYLGKIFRPYFYFYFNKMFRSYFYFYLSLNWGVTFYFYLSTKINWVCKLLWHWLATVSQWKCTKNPSYCIMLNISLSPNFSRKKNISHVKKNHVWLFTDLSNLTVPSTHSKLILDTE